MALNARQLQAAFARRRELEHQRCERTRAVSQYYDHWGKVTTRYENWVTPEYYKQADEQVRQKKEKKEKADKLTERRKKLRSLFDSESNTYEAEQRERNKPRGRRPPIETPESVKYRENIKRKLELEAKLYGKWRQGAQDENSIFESKSGHAVLAKLNWLEKQVDDKLQREREEAVAEERRLQMQAELARAEKAQLERLRMREQEINDVRALQEQNLQQLKQRQADSDELKQQEQQIRSYLDELSKELELLEEGSAIAFKASEPTHAYNLNKIRIFIRQRSEVFRKQIQLALNILQRVQDYCTKPEKLRELQNKCKGQLELETLTLAQIEAMYESETKSSLQRCEEMWQAQQLQRYQDMKQLLKDEQCTLALLLHDNLERQTDAIELRGTHLKTIEHSNDKLKQLMQEQDDASVSNSPRTAADAVSLAKSSEVLPAGRASSTHALPKVTNSFSNLNLDVWQDMTSARGGIDSPRLLSQRSLQVVTPDTATRPKFARKRVAWT